MVGLKGGNGKVIRMVGRKGNMVLGTVGKVVGKKGGTPGKKGRNMVGTFRDGM